MNDDILKLYNALQSAGYNDLGTSEQFGANVQDENKRKKLYDALIRDGYNDLGTFEQFSGRLVKPIEDQTQAARMEPQSVVESPVQKDTIPDDLNFDDEPQGKPRQTASSSKITPESYLDKFRIEREMEALGERPRTMSDEEIESQVTMDLAGVDPEILWAQAQDLYKTGAISKQEYLDAKKAYEEASASGASDQLHENRGAAVEGYRQQNQVIQQKQQEYDATKAGLEEEYSNNPLVKSERLMQQMHEDQAFSQKMAEVDREEHENRGEKRGFLGGLSVGWERMKAGLGNLAGETLTAIQKTFGVDGSADVYALALLQQFIEDTGGTGDMSNLLYTIDEKTGMKLPMSPGRIMGMDDNTILYGDAADKFKQGKRVISALEDAYKQSDGDLTKAYEYLKGKAEDLPLGMAISEGARMALNDTPETKGFGAWLGGQIPMLLPTAIAIGASFYTKNPEIAATIGKASFGMMAASSAGESMAQAREYGASDSEVWAAGFTDAAIMYAAGKIPFNRYTKRLFQGAERQISRELSSALADETSLAAKEVYIVK